MASGFSGGGGGGSILGFSPAVSAWNFGSFSLGVGGSLGSFIEDAQLADFFFSQGGPKLKPQPIAITASTELPGSTHWDPAPIPVGKANGGGSPDEGIVFGAGIGIPVLDLPSFLPDVIIEDQPPIIYSPPPILLPGQTDPGREELEEEEGEMAHTWLHLGSQVIGGLFPDQNPLAYDAGLGFSGPTGGGVAPGPVVAAAPVGPGVSAMYSGTCPPAKTRTLTIDCATGQEVKRKRRRRRALLTQGDMGVLFQIASLPNNANVRVALAGAIRR